MTEIELKFQVDPERRAALQRAVATATSRRIRLRALYFDTIDRRLAGAALALRVRREGRRWVQTLKGSGDGVWQRLEHEVIVSAPAGAVPAADPALHDGTPAGEALRHALGDALLQPSYGTEVTRCLRLLRAAGCAVELAFDSGALIADGRRWPLCELELELKSGEPAAMAAVAARWVARFGLSLDVRSKAERGDRLARGVTLGAAVRAQPLQLDAGVSGADALRAIVGNCMAQVLGNASDIAHGDSTPEQLHQLRVGLRRLRGALRDLGDLSAQLSAGWAPALATLFAGLGATRDRDALAQTLLPALRKAGAATLQLPAEAAPPLSPHSALREVATTQLWLELLAFAAGSGGAPLPFEPQVRERLAKLHRQIRRDAKRFDALDDVARHRLRKRVKRLRYLCEFAGSLYRPKRVRAFLKVLGPVQDALGAFNDLSVARALFEAVADSDPQAMFALGWLARERDAALLRCAETLRPLRKAEVFW